jgi:PhnB protein
MPAHQPAGYPTVSVYMMADGAEHVIDFVTDVLGGEIIMRIDRDDGSLMHGSLRLGDSVIMLADATEDAPAFPVWLHVYVPDVDATYQRALEKGAKPVQEPSEQGDGDRRGGVKDPVGNTWWIATPLTADVVTE